VLLRIFHRAERDDGKVFELCRFKFSRVGRELHPARARSLPNQDFGKRSTAIGEVESALIGSAPMPQDEVCRIEMAETRHRYGRS
jgi:hypothetical protein